MPSLVDQPPVLPRLERSAKAASFGHYHQQPRDSRRRARYCGPMIELHFWPTPNGHKITIFLEEAGLPYTLVPVNIGRGEQFRPEFLAIAPNNRMPAIVDRDPSDGGGPISVFESGAILSYLAQKTGRFLASDLRQRVQTLEWLFWQVGGLGPMAGQNAHFSVYAPEKIPYAIDRYVKETNRLYGVLDARLEDREFVAGDYSIADMAIWPWIKPWKNQGQNLDQFPALKAWYEKIDARPGVVRGMAAGEQFRTNTLSENSAAAEKARAILFGQRAR